MISKVLFCFWQKPKILELINWKSWRRRPWVLAGKVLFCFLQRPKILKPINWKSWRKPKCSQVLQTASNGSQMAIFVVCSLQYLQRECTKEKTSLVYLVNVKSWLCLISPTFPSVFKCLYEDVAFFQWFLLQYSVAFFSKIKAKVFHFTSFDRRNFLSASLAC